MVHLYKVILTLMLVILSSPMFAQSIISEDVYNSLKEQGNIAKEDVYQIIPSSTRQSHSFTPPDASYTLAMAPSDDGSSALITLPFNFCFYGQSVNKVFINTNGNISFDTPFSSGTPFNMPFAGHKIIAPFWADVDTRARGGVYYKLEANALIVNWEDVGHYNQNDVRGNSFQLIITNGTSPLLPFGYTVGFFYRNMEWTTGDASGGINGFDGAPAQVGINKGDGIKANVAGTFNKNSSSFITHPDSTSGVKWLEENNVYLNPCNNQNNRPSMMGNALRDTVGVCVGDTFFFSYYFPGGDVGQQTFVNIPAGFQGLNIIGVTPGFKTKVDGRVIGTTANMGTQVLTFNVADNGQPTIYDIIELVFQIDSLPEDPVISGNLDICSTDSTALSVQPIYNSYEWNSGQDVPNIIAYPGLSRVAVEFNKCVAEAQVNVVGFAPTVNISHRPYLCLPDTMTLTAPAGLDTYLWNTGETSNQITVAQPGWYSVSVTQFGCTNVDSVFIDTLSNAALAITTSRPVTCNGDSVTLFGNASVDSLWWSTGDTDINITVPSGNYTVYGSVLSSTGAVCIDSAQISIGASTFDSIILVGDTFFCGNGFAELTTTVLYEAYQWSNNNTGPYSSFVQPGNYNLQVLQNQCRDTIDFTIVGRPIPNPSIRGAEYVCGAGTTPLTLRINFFDSVLWSTGSVLDSVNVGAGQYTVTAWQGGCEGSTQFTVLNMNLGVRVKGSNFFCPNDSVYKNVDASFETYLWNMGDTTFDIYATQPGPYYCVVTLDTCTMTSDTAVVLEYIPEEVEIAGDTAMCDSLPGFLFTSVGYTSYEWNNGSFAAGIRYTQPGLYSVTITDENGCVNSDTVDVQVVPGIMAEISGDTHYCYQDSVILTAMPQGNYVWSTGDSVQQLEAGEGIYAVTVTAANGCRSFTKQTVLRTAPEVLVLGDTLICEGGAAQVYVPLSGIEQAVWSNGSTSDTTMVTNGIHSVTVTDIYGCSADDEFELSTVPSPIANFNVTPPSGANIGDEVKISDASIANGLTLVGRLFSINDTLFWTGMDTTIVFEEKQSMTIQEVIYASNGCTDTTRLNYVIEKIIVATNIMTPNGDGINDYLGFKNLDVYAFNEIEIYNRWGTLVYASKQYQNNWDAYGMSDGTYFYVLKSAEGPVVKGYVTVLR